jgi:hypothetical protein
MNLLNSPIITEWWLWILWIWTWKSTFSTLWWLHSLWIKLGINFFQWQRQWFFCWGQPPCSRRVHLRRWWIRISVLWWDMDPIYGRGGFCNKLELHNNGSIWQEVPTQYQDCNISFHKVDSYLEYRYVKEVKDLKQKLLHEFNTLSNQNSKQTTIIDAKCQSSHERTF